MNPEIQKELLSWLQGLKGLVESGAAFAKEQIPQVLWEKILLDRVYLTILVVFGLLLIIGVPIAFHKVFTRLINKFSEIHKKDRYGDDGHIIAGLIVTCITGAVGFLTGFILFFDNLYTCLNVWFAPRLYLIEWIKSLVSSVGK
jgi:hypothetical protein